MEIVSLGGLVLFFVKRKTVEILSTQVSSGPSLSRDVSSGEVAPKGRVGNGTRRLEWECGGGGVCGGGVKKVTCRVEHTF